MVNTWLADDARTEAARFGEALGEGARRAPDFIVGMAQMLGQSTIHPSAALLAAQAEFARVVGRAALTTAFNEVFREMAWLCVFALILVPFCRPQPLPAAAPPPDAH